MNIVLMHGVLGFGRIGPVDYFNGVAEHLKATFPRAIVLTTIVDLLGTVEQRAQQAADQIAAALASKRLEADKPIHIIAHSMGGLDARFLISHDLKNLKARVRTLICLGTPHLGSPVASLINHANPFELLPLSRVNSTFVDELRTRTNAVHDLSETAAAKFNADCPDVSTVHYFEVAGVGRDALFQTSALFQLPFAFVAAAAGRNDGVVPFTSATRRRSPAAIWPADHADMIGHDLNGPTAHSRPAFDYLSAYSALVRNFILQNQ